MIRVVREKEEARAQLQQKEGRLRHAQKIDSLEKFTGGLAHDFNNILTVILGNAEHADSKAR